MRSVFDASLIFLGAAILALSVQALEAAARHKARGNVGLLDTSRLHSRE